VSRHNRAILQRDAQEDLRRDKWNFSTKALQWIVFLLGVAGRNREGAYAKTKKNILDYTAGPPRNGRPAWKEIWLSMTINSLNYMTVEDLIEEWRGKVNKIGLQFHTPFVKGDPLMLPFGEVRNQVVDKIIALKKRYPDFIVNPISQLALMKATGVGSERRQ
jgi:hypothetical protein